MIELRPFHQDVINDIRRGYAQGHLREILELATGGGKMVVRFLAEHVGRAIMSHG